MIIVLFNIFKKSVNKATRWISKLNLEQQWKAKILMDGPGNQLNCLHSFNIIFINVTLATHSATHRRWQPKMSPWNIELQRRQFSMKAFDGRWSEWIVFNEFWENQCREQARRQSRKSHFENDWHLYLHSDSKWIQHTVHYSWLPSNAYAADLFLSQHRIIDIDGDIFISVAPTEEQINQLSQWTFEKCVNTRSSHNEEKNLPIFVAIDPVPTKEKRKKRKKFV